MTGFERTAKQRGTGYRDPCKTLREFAADFDVDFHALTQYMRHYPAGLPNPSLRTNNTGGTGKHNYYPIPAMRKWWRELQEKRNAISRS